MTYSRGKTIAVKKNITQKSKKPRRLRLKKSIRRFFAVLFGIAIFYILNTASFMRIHRIDLNVTSNLDSAQINDLFAFNDLVGMNFLWTPYEEISESIVSHPLIASVAMTPWPPGRLEITLTGEKPVMAMARSWGYYVLGENGQFIETIPPYFRIRGFPLKFSSENLLFDYMGHPRSMPWQELLAEKKISDHELMLALGYRDLLSLRKELLNQHDIPEVQYAGYDERYGLMLKCKGKPLILMGYGDGLMIHYTRAMKVLADDNFNNKEDKYIDIRFDEYQSAVDISKLQDSSPVNETLVD